MKNDIVAKLSSLDLITVLDSISDAVFIDDSDGYTLWCNKACFQLYKITPEEVVGCHVTELEKRGIFSPSVARIVLEEERESTIIHENKEGQTLLSTGSPIFDDKGKLKKVITTSRDITELSMLQRKLKNFRRNTGGEGYFKSTYNGGIIASSPAMFNVMHLAQKLAPVDSTVLITGESGVGKGVMARFLHDNGERHNKAFVTVNCGAIPETLIESELFGYEKGAFTGARADGKEGLFQKAQGGTIFLDEISELPLQLQVTLLQVIQERVITPVGSTKPIPIDVRIISATNKDLHQLVHENKFREDLYYRLNVVPIIIPALRERVEDIPPLIDKFLGEYNQKYNENKSLDREAKRVLEGFSWPGNIRELQNIVERLLLTTNGDVITIDNLPVFLLQDNITRRVEDSLTGALDQAEKDILIQALDEYKTTRAMAKALKVSQPTIVRKLKKHGIKSSDTKTYQ